MYFKQKQFLIFSSYLFSDVDLFLTFQKHRKLIVSHFRARVVILYGETFKNANMPCNTCSAPGIAL